MTIQHDDLMNRLAEHFARPDRMVWCDMPAGMAGSVRPDVFTLNKSFTQPKPTSYEVKVNKGDLESDLRTGKWQRYLKFSSGVTFVMPKGLAKAADIPKPAGVMFYDEEKDTFRTARAPALGTGQPGMDMMMKLLMDGLNRMMPERRAFNAGVWLSSRHARRELGEEVSKALRDVKYAEEQLDAVQQKIKDAETRHEQRTKQANESLEADKLEALKRFSLANIASIFDIDLSKRPPQYWETDLARAIRKKSPPDRNRLARHTVSRSVRELRRAADALEAIEKELG